MALKVLLVFVVCAFLAASKAEAGRISVNVTTIKGNVFCSANASANGTSTPPPPFPNARVELLCNNISQPLAWTLTNRTGHFHISYAQLTGYPVHYLVSNCTLMVNTPLNLCNASLPAVGRLDSALKILNISSTPLLPPISPPLLPRPPLLPPIIPPILPPLLPRPPLLPPLIPRPPPMINITKVELGPVGFQYSP